MGIKVTKNRDISNYGITEYICDTEADIINLPTDISSGSKCLCIENSKMLMLNTQKQWIEVFTGDLAADIVALAVELAELEKSVLYRPDIK